jgi:hypothetical protein
MIARLYTYTVEGVALAVALVTVAVLGLDTGTLIGAALMWGFTRGVLNYWLSRQLPQPMLVFLYVLALFGLVSYQFLVLASVIIAAFMLKEVKRLGNVGDILYGLKMGVPAFLFMIGGWLVIPFYEAVKMARRDVVGAVVIVVSTLMAIWALLSFLLSVSPEAALQLGIFKPLDPSNPFLWVGVIGYEELIGRPTPVANAFFVVLHAPSRLYYFYKTLGDILGAVAITIMVLAVIHFTTRWVFDLYQKHGLLASLAGHAVYNATLSADIFSPMPIFFFIAGLAVFIFLREGRG